MSESLILNSWKLAHGHYTVSPFRYLSDETVDAIERENDRLESEHRESEYEERNEPEYRNWMKEIKRAHFPMRASMDRLDKDEIKSRCDIVEIYRRLHPGLKIIERGRFVTAQAFCHDDQKPSLNLNREKKVYYCHPCASGSDIIGLVENSLEIGFVDALKWLNENS